MCWWYCSASLPSDFYIFCWLSWKVSWYFLLFNIYISRLISIKSHPGHCSKPWIVSLPKMSYPHGGLWQARLGVWYCRPINKSPHLYGWCCEQCTRPDLPAGQWGIFPRCRGNAQTILPFANCGRYSAITFTYHLINWYQRMHLLTGLVLSTSTHIACLLLISSMSLSLVFGRPHLST